LLLKCWERTDQQSAHDEAASDADGGSNQGCLALGGNSGEA
jgi:hypothetical protein